MHSAIHPIMAQAKECLLIPDNAQSKAFDLGAIAQRVRAKYLMLAHLMSPIEAEWQYLSMFPALREGGLGGGQWISCGCRPLGVG